MAEYIPYESLESADARSAEFWAHVRGDGWREGDVTQYLYSRRHRTGDPEADEDLPDGVDYAIRVTERDADLDALIVADDMEPQEAGQVAALYPEWALNTEYAVDEIVQYDNALWKCRSPHETLDEAWYPPNVPALWLRYRKNADTLLDWVDGERVLLGWQRTYDGSTYECIQAHVTQEDYAPDVTPNLWEVYEEPGGEEWQAGVAYAIGDVVMYNGTEYECLQAHTAQVGWEPPNVPALWSAL
jgi:hypothetical protein